MEIEHYHVLIYESVASIVLIWKPPHRQITFMIESCLLDMV